MAKNTVPTTPFMYYSNRLECGLMERELRSQAQWAAACAIGRFFKKTYKQARAVMIDAAQLQRELGSNPARSS